MSKSRTLPSSQRKLKLATKSIRAIEEQELREVVGGKRIQGAPTLASC